MYNFQNIKKTIIIKFHVKLKYTIHSDVQMHTYDVKKKLNLQVCVIRWL